ncbi:unnamed protein product [Spirodela intermedia]|uniref:Uncharacterized protein n=2 Tax=Spirodela intermedia TaxID=51605 RepID=A0ABN7EBX6_SPIIN|nr:unnamed protein product [Spirodela intermedia]CAA7403268.1 unnamed protein product [Spirodela intermedia]
MEISSFKVPRLSAEERTAKINRYLKKRNMRNFGKKIKYACRKTLADSRPRVRGRFAKSDEFEETTGLRSGHHDDEDDDDVYSMSTQTQEFKVRRAVAETKTHRLVIHSV